MVMKPDVLGRALEAAHSRAPAGRPSVVLLLTPQGEPLRQSHLQRWAASDHLILVTGRYEGFDERVRSLVDAEVSLGDFVLTGGEVGALAVIDGVVRLRPGTLGNAESPRTDSFSPGMDGLLEHPHYTRPPVFQGHEVPSVLSSGDHGAVARWRREQSLRRTRARRPDLLAHRPLSEADQEVLQHTESALPPVWWWLDGTSVLERPRDAELLAAGAAAYGVRGIFVAARPDGAPSSELQAALEALPPRFSPAIPARRRRKRVPPHELNPKDWFTVVEDPAVVRDHLGPQVRWVASRRPEGPAPVVGWPELRSASGVVVAFGEPCPPVEAGMVALRRASPYGQLPLPLAAVLQMERRSLEG